MKLEQLYTKDMLKARKEYQIKFGDTKLFDEFNIKLWEKMYNMKIEIKDYNQQTEEIKIINLDKELEEAHNEGVC